MNKDDHGINVQMFSHPKKIRNALKNSELFRGLHHIHEQCIIRLRFYNLIYLNGGDLSARGMKG